MKFDMYLLALIGIVAMVGVAFVLFQATRDHGQAVLASDASGSGLQVQAYSQEVYLKALADGTYDRNQLVVKAGVPVRLHFSTERGVGCGQQLVISGLNVRMRGYPDHDSVVEFTPVQHGQYYYTCGMGMWGPGTLVVEK